MYGNPIPVDFFKNEKLNLMFTHAIPMQSTLGIAGSLFFNLPYDDTQTVLEEILKYIPQFKDYHQPFLSQSLEQQIDFLNSSIDSLNHIAHSLQLLENEDLFSAANKLRKALQVRINIIQTVSSEEKGIAMNSIFDYPDIFFYSDSRRKTYALIPGKKKIAFNYDIFQKRVKPYMVIFGCGHEFQKFLVIGMDQCPTCQRNLVEQELGFYGLCTMHNQMGVVLDCSDIYCIYCLNDLVTSSNNICRCGKLFDASALSIFSSAYRSESSISCSLCNNESSENYFYKELHNRCRPVCHVCVIDGASLGKQCLDCSQDYVRLI